MTDSILNSTKKILGIAEDYTAFDLDIMTHINSVFSDLNQLGVGPDPAFAIDGVDETWAEFLGNNKNINSVKTYIYLRVRLIFDPPPTSFSITAAEKQIKESEWRLMVQMEGQGS